MPDDFDALNGLGVLVTRPEAQGQTLCDQIEAAGGRPTCMPALAIDAPAPEQQTTLKQADLSGYTCAIFVSRNAVDYAVQLLPDLATQLQSVNVAAVGSGTAAALAAHDIGVDVCPDERQSAEGLLEMEPLLDVMDRRVAIVRGEGGRELLRDELIDRGANVDYYEVYRRVMPSIDTRGLLAEWEDNVDVVVITSIETYDNLKKALGPEGDPHLHTSTVLVASQRIGTRAREDGCKEVINAGGASDRVILEALEEIAAEREDEG